MRAIKVEYTVNSEFVETNKANIQKVMDELSVLGDVGVHYSSYLKGDGQSFVHFAILRDEQAAQIVPSLDSFKNFRSQLKSGILTPPTTETYEMVGKSFEL